MSEPALARPLVVALAAALILLRSPDLLLNPQLFAEDGTIFLQEAWERPFPGSILLPHAGYLRIFPRLAASLALLVPLSLAPLVLSLLSLLVMVVPIAYLASGRMRPQWPSFAQRAVAAVLLAVAPASLETYANLANVHWHLTIAACLVLAAAPPRGRWQGAADAVCMGLFALSSPLAPVLLPPAAWLAWREGRGAGSRRWVAPALLGLGTAIQAAVVLADPRGAGAPGPAWEALPLVRETAMYGFFNAVLGIGGNLARYRAFGAAAYLAGFAAVALLAAGAIARRSRPLLLLLWAAAGTILLRHAFPLSNVPLQAAAPDADMRYYFLLVVFTLLAALDAVWRGGPLRILGAGVLAAAGLMGIPTDFHRGPVPDTHFRDQVAVFQSLPPGASYSFPVLPARFTPMVLRRGAGARGAPPPPAGLPVVPRQVYAVVTKVTFEGSPAVGKYVSVEGAALEVPGFEPPGGVVVMIDDRPFPAMTAPPYRKGRLEDDYRRGGFIREIPVDEIGAGRHALSLVALTRDRRACFPRTPAIPLDVP